MMVTWSRAPQVTWQDMLDEGLWPGSCPRLIMYFQRYPKMNGDMPVEWVRTTPAQGNGRNNCR